MSHRTLLPEGWDRPRGYAHGMVARGALLMTGGIIGWDEAGRFVSDDIAGQFDQVLVNTLAILEAGGARPVDVVRMTWYVTSRDAYAAALPAIGARYRAHMGRHYPAMAVVEVAALVEPDALIEIETTAVIPD